MKDYYYILGTVKGASKEEIRTAYYKLAKKFHPDYNNGDKFFEDRFKDIQEAYENLTKIFDNGFENSEKNGANNYDTSTDLSNYTEVVTVNGALIYQFDMIFVKGGSFEFGGTHPKAHMPNEKKPKHLITVDDFFIAKFPVTQGLWKAVMEYNRNPISNLFSKKSPIKSFEPADSPVCGISWEQAMKFVKQLNEITGKKYRLPLHEEWEYAALGGLKSNGYLYSGSDNLDDVAWSGGNCTETIYGPRGKEYRYVRKSVGLKLPNELGIHDMSGSVFEYCANAATKNLDHRIIKGGCYLHGHWCCEVKAFDSRHKDYGTITDGLRLAISI